MRGRGPAGEEVVGEGAEEVEVVGGGPDHGLDRHVQRQVHLRRARGSGLFTGFIHLFIYLFILFRRRFRAQLGVALLLSLSRRSFTVAGHACIDWRKAWGKDQAISKGPFVELWTDFKKGFLDFFKRSFGIFFLGG